MALFPVLDVIGEFFICHLWKLTKKPFFKNSFFKEFFLHPRRFECSNLSRCPLNVKNKCRACWILACARVYSVDSKREAILSVNQPVHIGHEINSDMNETKLSEGNTSCTIADCKQSIQPNLTARNPSSSPMQTSNDLVSSAVILQHILEQNGQSHASLPATSDTRSFYHHDSFANGTSESYSFNGESLSYGHKPIFSNGNSNEMTFNASHVYPPPPTPSGLSGVAAVAAAAAAVESAGAQQQRLNEALCAEMLMKLETVATQQPNSTNYLATKEIQHEDQKTNGKVNSFDEGEEGEKELVIDILNQDDEHPQMTIELQTNQSSANDSTDQHSNGSYNGEKIVPLENSMFVNLLPDLENIGIVAGSETINKLDTYAKPAQPNNAKEAAKGNPLLTNSNKRIRKSRSSSMDHPEIGSTIKKSKARVKNWCCLKCVNCLAGKHKKEINCQTMKFNPSFFVQMTVANASIVWIDPSLAVRSFASSVASTNDV